MNEIIAPFDEKTNEAPEIMLVPIVEALKTDKIALIDADFLKYFVVNAISNDMKNKIAHLKDPVAVHTKDYLDKITSIFDCPGYIFCFSGPSDKTFRNAVSFEKPYKGNRKYYYKYDKEIADKSAVVRYIQERYPTLLYSDLEADDLLGMLQDDDTFIYSYDKDLIQIPGTHYDHKSARFYEITKEDSLLFLMNQMITGDSVDNIPGLPNYGDVQAEKLLTTISAKQSVYKVFETYIRTYGYINGVDAFVESWNLLKLRGKRGTHFKRKYQGAFDLLEMLKNINTKITRK